MCFRFFDFDFGMVMDDVSLSMELKGIFLHKIDGCKSREEKARQGEGEWPKSEGVQAEVRKRASKCDVQNGIQSSDLVLL